MEYLDGLLLIVAKQKNNTTLFPSFFCLWSIYDVTILWKIKNILSLQIFRFVFFSFYIFSSDISTVYQAITAAENYNVSNEVDRASEVNSYISKCSYSNYSHCTCFCGSQL
jgi:hypothetical protein